MSKIIDATLEEVCLPIKGAIISGPFGSNISKKFFKEEGIPVIRGNNLSLTLDKFYDSGFVYVTEEKANELKCDAFKDDLIFTAAGTIGQVGIIPKDSKYDRYVISNKQIRARLDTTKVDLLYAYYWFSSPWIQQRIQKNNKGSTVPLLTLFEVKKLPIKYPQDLNEQHKISRVIDCISKKILNNNKINEKLEELARTIYDYWFLQFDFPDKNGKPYKTSGGKMVWNEELKQEIPEGWKVEKVSEYVDVVTGKEDANHSSPNGEYPFFTCSKDILRCDDYKFEGKTVLIAGNGDFNVKYYDGKFNAYQRTYVLIPENKNIIGLIYQSALRTIEKFKKGSNGSIVKFITKRDVDNIVILNPNENVDISIFNKILNYIENNKKENEKLKSLRDVLLPLLMNEQVSFKS